MEKTPNLTRAELQELALAEADVARLQQKVAELHQQLNQHREHQFDTLSDASDRRFLQHDFDSTVKGSKKMRYIFHDLWLELVPLCSRKESILVTGWNHIKGHKSSRQTRKQFLESNSLTDSKGTEPSAGIGIPLNDFGVVDSPSMPSSSRVAEVLDLPRHPSATSSTLVEYTTRIDFLKEQRSQLMEQLHSLDLYRPLSPSWI